MNSTPHTIVYFIRHAEDEEGSRELYQGEDSPLTDRGRVQAEALARIAHTLKIEHLITSPMQRARETARHLSDVLGLPAEENPLYREYMAPKAMLGKVRGSPESQPYISRMLENLHDPSWHYDDEENYHDLHRRAVDALTHLATHASRRIGVVTHAGFLRTILTAMMRDMQPDPELAVALMRTLKPANTGITEVHYEPDAVWRSTWRLVTFNDRSHLDTLDAYHT